MELLKELFRVRRYKHSQGRLIRRLTMAGCWVLFATAAWKCSLMDFNWVAGWWTWLAGWNVQDDSVVTFVRTFVPVFTYALSGLILLLGLWFGYRLVNWVTFGDFLISVEGEMAKVSWPGKEELRSSTIVVLTVFLILSGMIYIYDLILVFIFRFINVM